jgi:hypothetical protein
MKRKLILFIAFVVFLALYANAQSNSNNSITIQGNTYYFRPSTTPSSQPPTKTSDFYSSGSWYGEDAARTWAAISDWVIERCLDATTAITGGRNELAYISAIHIYKKGDNNFDSLRYIPLWDKQIRIDYWVVERDGQMADGKRETRWFRF